MRIEVDENRFDALQMEVGYAIARELHAALTKAGAADGERLEAALTEALFHIGCILDGSADIAGPEGPMRAVLTFRRDEGDDTLLSAGGGSWIHEYAHGIAEDYFDRLRTSPARARAAAGPPDPAPQAKRREGFLTMLRAIAEAFTKP